MAQTIANTAMTVSVTWGSSRRLTSQARRNFPTVWPKSQPIFAHIRIALMALRNRGGCTAQDICRYISHHSSREDSPFFKYYVTKALRELLEKGVVRKVRRGLYVLAVWDERISYRKLRKMGGECVCERTNISFGDGQEWLTDLQDRLNNHMEVEPQHGKPRMEVQEQKQPERSLAQYSFFSPASGVRRSGRRRTTATMYGFQDDGPETCKGRDSGGKMWFPTRTAAVLNFLVGVGEAAYRAMEASGGHRGRSKSQDGGVSLIDVYRRLMLPSYLTANKKFARPRKKKVVFGGEVRPGLPDSWKLFEAEQEKIRENEKSRVLEIEQERRRAEERRTKEEYQSRNEQHKVKREQLDQENRIGKTNSRRHVEERKHPKIENKVKSVIHSRHSGVSNAVKKEIFCVQRKKTKTSLKVGQIHDQVVVSNASICKTKKSNKGVKHAIAKKQKATAVVWKKRILPVRGGVTTRNAKRIDFAF
eukprot:GHVQ01028493.1.p1 GENE.GHVQ01028493.1~~GHVQ01028493.1.p1  ORF type:complete len:476 (+),score=68.09 GHVQ01028493.1:615-2042(+)